MDYERLVNAEGQRLVAFGQYAGIAGKLSMAMQFVSYELCAITVPLAFCKA